MVFRVGVGSVAALLLAGGVAVAQPARKAAPPPPAAPTPQQTTATFGDWILRCARPAGAPKSCELIQQVQQDAKPVAQTAIGSPGKGRALQLAILVPPSVSLGQKPALLPPAGEAELAALAWQRCLPGGCVAEVELGEAALAAMRGWTQPARITFADAAGRGVALPLLPVGLPQALDALAREDAD